MELPFIDLKAQYRAYQAEIDREIQAVIHSARFIKGPRCVDLEKALCRYTGAGHAIGCSSGTDALLLSLMALDIGPGDEVITTPFTFVATAEVVSVLGARAVFVDIDASTYTMDVDLIEDAITGRTKAIMPVSIFGQCADMDEINAIGRRHGLPVIEDGCQSFGATYKGARSCNLSTVGCTSFYPAKPLGCFGDGGAVFTSDDTIAEKIRMLLNHGEAKPYQHKYIGINGRLDELQAAVLNVKLRHFDDELRARAHIARQYTELLATEPMVTPKVKSDRTSVFAQYAVRVPERQALAETLKDSGIPTAVHYPTPIHLQEAFSSLGYGQGDFPIAERVCKEILSLPMSSFLTPGQQDFIVNTIKG